MKTPLEQLEFWIEQYYRINGTPTLDDIKGQIILLKDYEKQQSNAKAKALLEEAAEKAKVKQKDKYKWEDFEPFEVEYVVDKKSILSLIPKEQ